ncbi:MAG: anti-sigma factor [Actinomycetia bacterium]|nr:anti-sigma factor [Actinomycetes bacterium]
MTDQRQDEVGENIESLLREMTGDDATLVDPPADLWSRIEAETGIERADADIIPFGRPRPVRWSMPLAAAAAVVLVLGFAVVANRNGDDSTVLAEAKLAYDAANFDELGSDAAAQVSLVDADGTLLIDIAEADLPDPAGEDADLELWLIQPDADGNPADLVSLGLIDPDQPGAFEIPDTHDPDVFFIVDVSVEPRDGDTAHSGRSILRGALDEI